MKFASILATAALCTVVGAQAQSVVDLNARLTASGNLVSSMNPVAFSLRGGTGTFRNLTITDNGAGNASNLAVSVQRTSGALADLSVIMDTCTTATVTPNGTCSLRLVADGTCPKAETSTWNVLITSTTAPTLVIPVTVTSLAGACD
jgi:hypothetical protein